MDMATPGNPDPAEKQRRKFLLVSTAGVGAVGLVAATIPLVESMAPSERAKAAGAPAGFDIARLAPAALATLEWRGKPIWVLRRTPAMLANLGRHDALLLDPNSDASVQPPYAKNLSRARRPEFLVVTAVCTHLGCIPVYRPEPGAADLGADWPGGFYCPCHGSKYDLAGRVFRNVPAPTNLEVPPYAFHGSTLVVGEEHGDLSTAT